MDPLKLPEPCANKILSYLTGKELLSAMEVSQYWHDFIKVRGGVMDKLIFRPPLVVEPLPLMNQVFSVDHYRRLYKHMITPINLRKENEKINPIGLYASTLETLEVNTKTLACTCFFNEFKSQGKKIEQCNFPKLRKLTFSLCNLSDLLDGSTFPVLTHLQIKCIADDSSCNYCYKGHTIMSISFQEIKEALHSLPQLKVLIMDFYAFKGKPQDEIAEQLTLNRPKIQEISMKDYFHPLLKDYELSLERLQISSMFSENVPLLLQDLKVLKSLSLYGLYEIVQVQEKLYARSESIEILKIFSVGGLPVSDIALRNLLLALPSLKELVLFDDYALCEETLKFLGETLLLRLVL